jgi:hypothetical protein
MGNSNNLQHARHNEKVCKYLNKKEEFSDWVITTAFYSALHFVRYKIFPLRSTNRGKQITYNDFEQCYRYDNPANLPKHEFLVEKVTEHIPEIASHYAFLHDTCKNARYINYKYSREVSSKAVKYLKNIEEVCSTKE